MGEERKGRTLEAGMGRRDMCEGREGRARGGGDRDSHGRSVLIHMPDIAITLLIHRQCVRDC